MSIDNVKTLSSGTLTLRVWNEGPYLFEGERLKVLRNAVDFVVGGGVFLLNLSQKPVKPSSRKYVKPCLKIVAGKYRQLYSLKPKELQGLISALVKAEAGEHAEFGFGYRITACVSTERKTVGRNATSDEHF